MRGIKIGYCLLNPLGIFRDIMQFRIISRRKSTSRNSRVIQISSQKRFQQTTLSDPGNISGPLRGGMDIRFSFAENISYLSHITTAKFQRGDSIPCFICIISFSRFKNALAKINMSELGPRHKKLSCWYKKKI